MKFNKRNIIKKTLITLLALIILLFGGFYIYTLNYYKASDVAKAAIADNNINVVTKDNMTIFSPKTAPSNSTGIIFYPGGKVEYTAYAPLLSKLAEKNITVVLLKMPFNLAMFNINAADKVYDKFPEIKNWYISGHSLGGAMGSSYAIAHENKIKGLILLAAYPTKETDIKTIAIYGSEDKVVNRSKLDLVKNKIEIPGGNHGQFGNYGEQKGDGKATITAEDQQSQTVEDILNFIQ